MGIGRAGVESQERVARGVCWRLFADKCLDLTVAADALRFDGTIWRQFIPVKWSTRSAALPRPIARSAGRRAPIVVRVPASRRQIRQRPAKNCQTWPSRRPSSRNRSAVSKVVRDSSLAWVAERAPCCAAMCRIGRLPAAVWPAASGYIVGGNAVLRRHLGRSSKEQQLLKNIELRIVGGNVVVFGHGGPFGVSPAIPANKEANFQSFNGDSRAFQARHSASGKECPTARMERRACCFAHPLPTLERPVSGPGSGQSP